jgi:chromosomal replication initiator protein
MTCFWPFMYPKLTFARFVPTPENRAAWDLLHEVVAAFHEHLALRLPNPIFLHGPSGSGKTHLVAGLLNELTKLDGTLAVQHLSANDWHELLPPPVTPLGIKSFAQETSEETAAQPTWLDEARHSDLVILEDLHHLPGRAAEALVQLLDVRLTRGLPTVVTAPVGPRQLAARGQRLPARLTSRLAAGLVIALDPLQAPSRLLLLEEFAQRRQLAIAPEILHWLAAHLTGGGRQIEGAIAQLNTLAKLQRHPLKLADVRPHFRVQLDALRPSVERIVQQVGGHFHVAPTELLSRRRLRTILVPRQISMYLARQLTQMSFQRIGACFGGHDHSTVMHACRKVERALVEDAMLGGAVRQLQSELA